MMESRRKIQFGFEDLTLTRTRQVCEELIVFPERLLYIIKSFPNAISDVFDGFTLLHVAASKGNIDAIRILVHHGAAIDAIDAYRRTPLHHAILKGNQEAVLVLLELGSQSFSWRMRENSTIFHRLVEKIVVGTMSPEDMLKFVLPIYARMRISSKETVKLFDLVDVNGRTALGIAAESNKPIEIIELLLRYGSTAINDEDQYGVCPLFASLKFANPIADRFLLAMGANPNISNLIPMRRLNVVIPEEIPGPNLLWSEFPRNEVEILATRMRVYFSWSLFHRLIEIC